MKSKNPISVTSLFATTLIWHRRIRIASSLLLAGGALVFGLECRAQSADTSVGDPVKPSGRAFSELTRDEQIAVISAQPPTYQEHRSIKSPEQVELDSFTVWSIENPLEYMSLFAPPKTESVLAQEVAAIFAITHPAEHEAALATSKTKEEKTADEIAKFAILNPIEWNEAMMKDLSSDEIQRSQDALRVITQPILIPYILR